MLATKKQLREFDREIRKEFNEDLKNGSEIMTKHSEQIHKIRVEINKYAECHVCGHIVNKEKMQVEWKLENKTYVPYTMFLCDLHIPTGEKEAVKTYICKHCQPKKKK